MTFQRATVLPLGLFAVVVFAGLYASSDAGLSSADRPVAGRVEAKSLTAKSLAEQLADAEFGGPEHRLSNQSNVSAPSGSWQPPAGLVWGEPRQSTDDASVGWLDERGGSHGGIGDEGSVALSARLRVEGRLQTESAGRGTGSAVLLPPVMDSSISTLPIAGATELSESRSLGASEASVPTLRAPLPVQSSSQSMGSSQAEGGIESAVEVGRVARRDLSGALPPASGAPSAIAKPAAIARPRRMAPGPVVLPKEYLAALSQRLEGARTLARKGAFFSADEELDECLRDLAMTIDGMRGGTQQLEQIQRGLIALDEAGEFFENEPTSESMIDWVRVISHRHKTELGEVRSAQGMSRIEALQHYYDFGLASLVSGCDGQAIGAEILFSLGKLHQSAASDADSWLGPFNPHLPVPKSVVFYQAALMLDPRHASSANELGVALGRLGQWGQALSVLRSSVSTEVNSIYWRNLAEAHRRNGQWELARAAQREADRLAASQGGVNPQVPAVLIHERATVGEGQSDSANRVDSDLSDSSETSGGLWPKVSWPSLGGKGSTAAAAGH